MLYLAVMPIKNLHSTVTLTQVRFCTSLHQQHDTRLHNQVEQIVEILAVLSLQREQSRGGPYDFVALSHTKITGNNHVCKTLNAGVYKICKLPSGQIVRV